MISERIKDIVFNQFYTQHCTKNEAIVACSLNVDRYTDLSLELQQDQEIIYLCLSFFTADNNIKTLIALIENANYRNIDILKKITYCLDAECVLFRSEAAIHHYRTKGGDRIVPKQPHRVMLSRFRLAETEKLVTGNFISTVAENDVRNLESSKTSYANVLQFRIRNIILKKTSEEIKKEILFIEQYYKCTFVKDVLDFIDTGKFTVKPCAYDIFIKIE